MKKIKLTKGKNALAYDGAALKYFGKFARLNFVEVLPGKD